LTKLLNLQIKILLVNMKLTCKKMDHTHSTMGRAEDKARDVIEYLIIAKQL
jgi:hypothetical protein